jgi:ankyrin repeat protein
MAVRKKNKRLVDLLISHGADVDGANGLIGGPILLAAEEGLRDIVMALLSRKANVNKFHEEDRRTPLHWAAHNGHKDVVSLLMSNGANVHAVDRYGKQPCDYAAQRGHAEIVRMLNSGA